MLSRERIRTSSTGPHFCSIIVLIFAVSLLFVDSFATATIAPGSTLYASTPNQTWSSSSNAFSLHFMSMTTTTYSLAITYDGSIPIWKAGGDVAVADASASFHFLPDGNLRLLNGSGAILWQSNTANLGVSSAVLDDSGNFILRNGSVSVWTTFDHPTDTVVPSQNFTIHHVLTSGFYSFHLLSTGNLALEWNNTIVYWNFGVNSSDNVNLTNPILALQSSGILSVIYQMVSKFIAYSSDFGEEGKSLRFLKLDNDGNLRIYSYAKGSGGSAGVVWTGVSDQCEVFGYCGNLGICSYNDAGPSCGCPSENFDLIDAEDSRKGCKRKVELEDCPLNATLLQMDHTRFLTYAPETSTDVFIVDITACKYNCLTSGSCVASTILAESIGNCYMKISNFVSGYQSPAIPSTSFVKVCSPALPNPPSPSMEENHCTHRKLNPLVVVVLAVVTTLLASVIFVGSLWWWCCINKSAYGGISAQYSLLEYASGAPMQFSYKELHRATKGFEEKLGAGGFGAVYKGILVNKMVVAVKKLEGIEQGEKQFRMEVATISWTHHLNLVRLIGFCSEGRHRLLVYEFMKNGSLDNILFTSNEDSGKLNWESRFRIALGSARGITYLHEECRDCIVHCDIKPENILLDENCNAKVSDFGLAKLMNPKGHRRHTLTSVRGTRGYLAPEWLTDLPISSKSDVYSYGMVLLEIVSGRRNFEVSDATNGKKFSLWAYEEFEKGNVKNVLDKRLDENDVDMDRVTRTIQVSFWCIQEQPLQRPVMGKVVQMLEGIVEIKKPPHPTAATGDPSNGAGTLNLSSCISALSTLGSSGPVPSSSSSFQTGGAASSVYVMNVEGQSSSLLTRSSKF
ncbi:hypothetical protein Ancab_036596 [Ancistrocladus abbreviatus]